jgi:hypothetical protein
MYPIGNINFHCDLWSVDRQLLWARPVKPPSLFFRDSCKLRKSSISTSLPPTPPPPSVPTLDYFHNFTEKICALLQERSHKENLSLLPVRYQRFMYKLYRHKLYRHNLYRHKLYRHKLYREQIVSGTNCIGNKLYREHIVSGTNCIGNKLYRKQTVSAPFNFFTLSFDS